MVDSVTWVAPGYCPPSSNAMVGGSKYLERVAFQGLDGTSGRRAAIPTQYLLIEMGRTPSRRSMRSASLAPLADLLSTSTWVPRSDMLARSVWQLSDTSQVSRAPSTGEANVVRR